MGHLRSIRPLLLGLDSTPRAAGPSGSKASFRALWTRPAAMGQLALASEQQAGLGKARASRAGCWAKRCHMSVG